MIETEEIVNIIRDTADPDVLLIYGQIIEPSMEGYVSVTVIATGFPEANASEGKADPLANVPPVQKTSVQQSSKDGGNLVSHNDWTKMNQSGSYLSNRSNDINIPTYLRNMNNNTSDDKNN